MFVQHDESGSGGGPPWQPRRDDPAGAGTRGFRAGPASSRLGMVRPLGSARDSHVHALLQQRFGETGLGLEHHLRCLIVGLAQRAVRPIRLHLPCHGALADDEQRLLLALGACNRPARLAAVLAPLAGSRGGELQPLLAGIAALLPAE
jgi:hypothetical protein